VVVQGAEPLFFLDLLCDRASSTVGRGAKSLIAGIFRGLRGKRLAPTGGRRKRPRCPAVSWARITISRDSASALWKRMPSIDGSATRAGDVVLGLTYSGTSSKTALDDSENTTGDRPPTSNASLTAWNSHDSAPGGRPYLREKSLLRLIAEAAVHDCRPTSPGRRPSWKKFFPAGGCPRLGGGTGTASPWRAKAVFDWFAAPGPGCRHGNCIGVFNCGIGMTISFGADKMAESCHRHSCGNGPGGAGPSGAEVRAPALRVWSSIGVKVADTGGQVRHPHIGEAAAILSVLSSSKSR